MINKLKQLYNKELFDPCFWGLFFNPFYIARKGLAKAMRMQSKHICGKVLDVGCGKKPYQHFFNCDSYIGMDVEQSGHLHKNENVDVFYDGKVFPFKDDEFDSIVCNQTLEHVFTPELFVNQMYRVLKQDGKVLLSVPFVWDEHEQPYDYARYSSFGLKSLFEKAGFKVIYQGKTVDNIQVVFQLWNDYLYKIFRVKSKTGKMIFTLIFMFPSNLIGLFLSTILPSNQDLYLDNILVVKKMKK